MQTAITMVSSRRFLILSALPLLAAWSSKPASAQTVQVDVRVQVHVDGAGQLAPPPAPGEPVTPAPAPPAEQPPAQPAPVQRVQPGTLVPAYSPPPLRLQQPMQQGPLRVQRPRRSYAFPISMIAAGAVTTAMSSMVYAIEESYSYGDDDHQRLLIATGVGAAVFAAGIGLLIHRIRRYRAQRALYNASVRPAAW